MKITTQYKFCGTNGIILDTVASAVISRKHIMLQQQRLRAKGRFMPTSVSPLTPHTPRGAFSSLNSLLTPFTAYFRERIDLLSGCWRRVVVRALQKNQRDSCSLDSGGAGLSGDGVEAHARALVYTPVTAMTSQDADEPLAHVALLKDTLACRF